MIEHVPRSSSNLRTTVSYIHTQAQLNFYTSIILLNFIDTQKPNFYYNNVLQHNS